MVTRKKLSMDGNTAAAHKARSCVARRRKIQYIAEKCNIDIEKGVTS